MKPEQIEAHKWLLGRMVTEMLDEDTDTPYSRQSSDTYSCLLLPLTLPCHDLF
jgi:hypothetical protein